VEHFGGVFGAEQNTPIYAHLLTPIITGDAVASLGTGQTHTVRSLGWVDV